MSTVTFTPASLAIRAAANGKYYGLMYLKLASLAYLDQSHQDIVNVGTDLPKAIAALPVPPPPADAPTVTGAWQVVWGPEVYGTDENLMYIASFYETGNQHRYRVGRLE